MHFPILDKQMKPPALSYPLSMENTHPHTTYNEVQLQVPWAVCDSSPQLGVTGNLTAVIYLLLECGIQNNKPSVSFCDVISLEKWK